MNRLPFIPKAQPRESPLSVLRRSAVNNGYQRVLALMHSLIPHIDYSNGMLGYIARNPALYRRIASLLGIQSSNIDLVAYDRVGSAREDKLLWQGLKIPYNDLHFTTEKLCIPCFLEKGYALSEWDHKAAVGCTEHRVYLEDHCPVCHTSWTFDREPFSCGCDHFKITAQLRPIPMEQASLLSNIIANGDQAGIENISLILEFIKWWKQIGIRFTKESEAACIYRIYNGQNPDLSTAKTGKHLHSQVLLLPILTQTDDTGRSITNTINPSHLSKIQSACINKVEISRIEAQAVLGISRVRFDKFIEEGLISANDNSQFPLNDINQLLLSSTWLPFDSVKQQLLHKSLSKDNLSLAHLVRIELTGQLKGRRCIKSESGEKFRNHLTIPEASKKLKTNSESIRYLIKVGKLPANKGTPKSSVQWAIAVKDFDTFDRQYIFASAIAREINLPVTTTSSRLISAGIKPVSGPGIDKGRTYVFSRDDIKGYNLRKFLQGPYQSPAGRKPKSQQVPEVNDLTSKDLAGLLQIDTHQVRRVVRDGWIIGKKNSPGHYRFDPLEAHQLVEHIDRQYIDIEIASAKLGMSVRPFRYTWISTGYVREYKLGKRRLVTQEGLEKISGIWSEHTTSTYIGKMIGRHRSFCNNLEKMGLIEPTMILGESTSKTKLYPRKHPLYRCYRKELLSKF